MRQKLHLVLALAMLVICSTSAFAIADPFAMTYGPGQTPGTWVYTLINNDTTGDVIPTGLDLVWDPAMPTSYYTVSAAPAGWVINSDYDWPAWDAIANTPGPGEKLKGFAITAPTHAPYFTVYYNILSDSYWQDGEVVPEPSSMLALLGGVGALGAMIRRRRA